MERSIRGLVILRVKLQNSGKVAAMKQEACIGFSEKKIALLGSMLPEWLTLAGDNVSADQLKSKEEPIPPNQGREILSTTKKIEPGEVVTVDFLYRLPANTVSHCLVQFKAKLGFFTCLFHPEPSDSWTTTAWVVRPESVKPGS